MSNKFLSTSKTTTTVIIMIITIEMFQSLQLMVVYLQQLPFIVINNDINNDNDNDNNNNDDVIQLFDTFMADVFDTLVRSGATFTIAYIHNN